MRLATNVGAYQNTHTQPAKLQSSANRPSRPLSAFLTLLWRADRSRPRACVPRWPHACCWQQRGCSPTRVQAPPKGSSAQVRRTARARGVRRPSGRGWSRRPQNRRCHLRQVFSRRPSRRRRRRHRLLGGRRRRCRRSVVALLAVAAAPVAPTVPSCSRPRPQPGRP